MNGTVQGYLIKGFYLSKQMALGTLSLIQVAAICMSANTFKLSKTQEDKPTYFYHIPTCMKNQRQPLVKIWKLLFIGAALLSIHPFIMNL